MARPPIDRIVRTTPAACYYKPRGVPLRTLGEVVIGLDELEALRLADLEGLDQEATGRRMGVSRQTVGRILEAAHRKVADALVTGKALRLEGGPIQEPPPGPPPWGRGRGPGGGRGRRRRRGRGGGRGRGRGGPPGP